MSDDKLERLYERNGRNVIDTPNPRGWGTIQRADGTQQERMIYAGRPPVFRRDGSRAYVNEVRWSR